MEITLSELSHKKILLILGELQLIWLQERENLEINTFFRLHWSLHDSTYQKCQRFHHILVAKATTWGNEIDFLFHPHHLCQFLLNWKSIIARFSASCFPKYKQRTSNPNENKNNNNNTWKGRKFLTGSPIKCDSIYIEFTCHMPRRKKSLRNNLNTREGSFHVAEKNKC